MHDLADRLADAGPPPPIVLDHVHLSGRARSVRRRQRLVGSSALCLALVAIGAAGYTAVAGGGTDLVDGTPAIAPASAGQEQAEALPDEAASLSVPSDVRVWAGFPAAPTAPLDGDLALLGDGRVFVLGQAGYRMEVVTAFEESAIGISHLYDPADGSWEEVETPPFDDAEGFGSVQAEGNQVLVSLDNEDGDRRLLAIYDGDAGTWTRLPEAEIQWPVTHFHDGSVTLFSHGAGFEYPSGEPGNEYDMLITNEGNEQVLRWSPGQDGWEAGSPSPLSARQMTAGGVVGGGDRIYQIGGVPNGLDLFPGDHDGEGYLRDGAVYDIAADTWSPLPDIPEGSDMLELTVGEDGEVLASGSVWNGTERVDTGRFRLTDTGWEAVG